MTAIGVYEIKIKIIIHAYTVCNVLSFEGHNMRHDLLTIFWMRFSNKLALISAIITIPVLCYYRYLDHYFWQTLRV